jgi:shikimate 5-dehydrogenase
LRLKIGVAGMGRMGSAMAARLLKLGREVTVWNRTAENTKPLMQAGAGVAAAPEALAEAYDLIITILLDARGGLGMRSPLPRRRTSATTARWGVAWDRKTRHFWSLNG